MPDVDLAGLGERAAEAVHHAWLGVQAAAGIRSRLAAWGEELVAPWEALSERAKDLDRATVAATLEYVRPHIMTLGLQEARTRLAAVDTAKPPATEHRYLSCACLHAQLLKDAGDEDQAKELHKQCGKAQHDRGEDGHPHCKYCPSPCRCRCHVETGEAT